jgi:hypothetical protein
MVVLGATAWEEVEEGTTEVRDSSFAHSLASFRVVY